MAQSNIRELAAKQKPNYTWIGVVMALVLLFVWWMK